MPRSEWMVDPDYLIPAEHLMSVSITAAEGRSLSEQQLPGVDGPLSLGWLGCLLDATGGRPLAFSLPEGQRCMTVGMRVDVVARRPRAGERVLGRGELLHLGPDFAVSRATISAQDGLEIVTAVVRFALAPEVATVWVPRTELVPEQNWGDRPDLAGGLGVEVVRLDDGHAELAVMPTPALGNPYAIVHGGIHLALADVGMTTAMGDGYALLDASIEFHRPIPIDGTALRIVATVVRRGERVGVADASLIGPDDGTLFTSVRGTFGRIS